MDVNNTSTSSDLYTKIFSTFSCPHMADGFKWDLNNTTIPWIIVVIVSIASPITVLLNVFVVIAVKKRKELQKLSNILLSSLAVTDLLVGSVNMPLFAAVDALVARQVMLEYVCTLDAVNISFMYFLSLSTLYHLTAIAWERYVAILKWIDYRVIVTRSRLRNLSIISWLLAVFIAIPSMAMALAGVDNGIVEKWHVGMNVIAAACLIVIGYFYVMVYLEVQKRKTDAISNVTALVRAKLESKVAKTTSLLTAALVLSYLPGIAGIILGNVFPAIRTISVVRLFAMLTLLNALTNALLYCFRDRKFRNAIQAMLGMRKPLAIPTEVGAARSLRQKDPLGSVELCNMERPCACLTRPASCEPALLSSCVHPFRMPRLKQSLSDSTLRRSTRPFDGLHLQQPSSGVLMTNEIIQSGSNVGRKMGKTKSDMAANDASSNPQGTVRLGRYRPRSRSFDTITSVKFANHCQKRRTRRPKTAQAKITVPGKTFTRADTQ